MLQEINEANEVLSNDILHEQYDVYIKEKTAKEQQRESQAKKETVPEANKKTFTKTRTVHEEERLYVRGTIHVKYWGEPDIQNEGALREFIYRVSPTAAEVTINEKNIYPVPGIPADYQKAFTESDVFLTPIPQPVSCIIITADGKEHYKLELRDIRLRDIHLSGITKYEKQSLGSLDAEIFAFIIKITTKEITEEETIYSGPTGIFETKEEGEYNCYRNEWYHPDGSKEWSEWIRTKKQGTRSNYKEPVFAEAAGCLQYWWVPVIFLILIAAPKAFLFFGIIALLALSGLIFGWLFSSSGRLIPLLSLALFIFLILNATGLFSKRKQPFIQHENARYDSLRTTTEPIQTKDITEDTEQNIPDTLITHYIRWKDYDSNSYEARLSVALSAVQLSANEHERMDPFIGSYSLAPIYNNMITEDEPRMNHIYNALDSLRIQKNLDSIRFARMLVSCVQSLPYFLVVDKGCADQYNDAFTMDYLANCKSDCCIGYEKYGVRSPAEFLADLKGDCDTRALFLYEILKHYHYNVALLTSLHYKHALIAVNLPGSGIAKNIHNKNYWFWETTAAGYDIGNIPPQLQNINYWDVALLNEK